MTRDQIQVLLLLGFLVEKGFCRKELGSYLNINVEMEGETHELKGYVLECAPLGIKVVPVFSLDGKTVPREAEENLSKAVRELVLDGRQFCTPWRNCDKPPVILWADCGVI